MEHNIFIVVHFFFFTLSDYNCVLNILSYIALTLGLRASCFDFESSTFITDTLRIVLLKLVNKSLFSEKITIKHWVNNSICEREFYNTRLWLLKHTPFFRDPYLLFLPFFTGYFEKNTPFKILTKWRLLKKIMKDLLCKRFMWIIFYQVQNPSIV